MGKTLNILFATLPAPSDPHAPAEPAPSSPVAPEPEPSRPGDGGGPDDRGGGLPF